MEDLVTKCEYVITSCTDMEKKMISRTDLKHVYFITNGNPKQYITMTYEKRVK